jgi:hypothetical protein
MVIVRAFAALIAPAMVNHTDLARASGVFQTMRGEIRVSWSYDQASHHVALNVTLPPNVIGEVVLPCSAETVDEGGKAVW